MLDRLPFKHVVAIDFEFEFGGHDSTEAAGRSGERPRPVCMVAKELRSGQTWRLWRGQFETQPPFPIDDDTVLVAYYASAELGCFKALGWPQPKYVLDLFTEFRARTNGVQRGARLVNAATLFRDRCHHRHREAGHGLRASCAVVRGRPTNRPTILDYCESDVRLLERLLPAMLPRIDLPRALLRGRFMKAAAAIEWNGTPIDTATLDLLRRHWTGIQDELIAEIDRDYGVFDGRSFRRERWQRWLAAERHPVADAPKPANSSSTTTPFGRWRRRIRRCRRCASCAAPCPRCGWPILRSAATAATARILSAFRSRTGRCQPSNTKYIFGPSVWLRGLIQPPEGWGVAYHRLEPAGVRHRGGAVRRCGDAGRVPVRRSIPRIRQAGRRRAGRRHQENPRRRARAVQAMRAGAWPTAWKPKSLAQRIGQPEIVARDLLRSHRETYRKFWAWSDATVDRAMLLHPLLTVFGWPIRIGSDPNPRSLRNFPCQANGAEMLRLAACFATEQGVEVCALIHDAVLIAAPLDQLDRDIERMQAAMAKASRVVLDGFELRTDVNVVRYPDRYQDPRGAVMWERVMKLVAKREAAKQEVA